MVTGISVLIHNPSITKGASCLLHEVHRRYSPCTLSFAFQGKCAEAEPLFERSQAIRAKLFGPEHPSVADDLDNIAALLDAQVGSERSYCRRVLGFVGEQFCDAHPCLTTVTPSVLHRDEWRTCSSKNHHLLFAAPCSFQGRHAEAEPLHKRSQAIRGEVLDPEHPDLANVLSNRALCLEEQVGISVSGPQLSMACLHLVMSILVPHNDDRPLLHEGTENT